MSADQSDQMGVLLRQSLHDFNNVLGLILGFAGLLVRDLEAARAANPALGGCLDKAQEILAAAVQGEAIVKQMTAVIRSGPTTDVARAAKLPAAPGRPAAPAHILLVKEDQEAAAELARALAGIGWTTEVQAGGGAALRSFRAKPNAIDAVITDQTVAEIAGPELIDALKALSPSLPCVLLLDPRQPLDRESQQLVGADAVRNQPVAAQDVVGLIRELLETRGRRGG